MSLNVYDCVFWFCLFVVVWCWGCLGLFVLLGVFFREGNIMLCGEKDTRKKE